VEHLHADPVIVSGSHTYRHGPTINSDFVQKIEWDTGTLQENSDSETQSMVDT
jgi:hypothetical protein